MLLIMKKLTDSQKERLNENYANYNEGTITYERHEEISNLIINSNN